MGKLKGFIGLVFDVVDETTNLVERTHDAVVDRTVRRFAPLEPAKSTATVVTSVQRAISGGVFESIRVVNGLVRDGADAVIDLTEHEFESAMEEASETLATPLSSEAAGTASWVIDQAQASINGLWGDYLARRQSDLDLGMDFRVDGRSLQLDPQSLRDAIDQPSSKVAVFVHGLATTEWLWSLDSEEHYGTPAVTFGSRLRDDYGITPLYVRYNTGRHISQNGQALSELLAELVDAYPLRIEEITLVGHSMGGLVARSAAHYGDVHRSSWVSHLRHLACIGSPHLGAPLEKSVNLLAGILRRVDAAGAQVPAEVLGTRSAGIKDLRHGYILDDEWYGADPDSVFLNARRNVPLVDGVGYYFVAATISPDPSHPIGTLLGDLLVRLPSASGQAPEPAHRIPFRSGVVLPGMDHVHLANHPAVYDALQGFLGASFGHERPIH
ncbi:MAG: alpha/beta fold hydrolase [Myxococcota bacterium]